MLAGEEVLAVSCQPPKFPHSLHQQDESKCPKVTTGAYIPRTDSLQMSSMRLDRLRELPDTSPAMVFESGPHAATPASALASAVDQARMPPMRLGFIGPVPDLEAQHLSVCGARSR